MLQSRTYKNYGNPNRENQVFLFVRYFGDPKENDWFVQIQLGEEKPNKFGDQCGRLISWHGKVYGTFCSAYNLEQNGEGLYLNSRQLEWLYQKADGGTGSKSDEVEVRLCFHRDQEAAASHRSPMLDSTYLNGEKLDELSTSFEEDMSSDDDDDDDEDSEDEGDSSDDEDDSSESSTMPTPPLLRL